MPSSQIRDINQELKEYYSRAKTMLGAKSLMVIDMMATMPKGAFSQRVHDIDIMAVQIHECFCADFIGESLVKCREDIIQNPKEWEQWDKANLLEMEKIYNHYASIPADLFSKFVHIQSSGRHIR